MPDWKHIIERLPEPLRRDPKKTAILAALGVLLVGVAIKQLVQNSPAAAQAGAQANQAGLAGTPGGVAGQNAIDQNNARHLRADKLEQWLEKPLAGPGRDLFAMRMENFQTTSTAAHDPAVVARSDRFWDRLAKSLTSQADLRRQREIRVQNIQVAARKLKLQSTMLRGAMPRAMIDGKMIRVGDTLIADPAVTKLTFTVKQIEARRVVIERDGVRLEITMDGKARLLRDDE